MKQRRYCVKFCGMLSAALSAFTFAQAHANPLSFPEYEQELTVRFATPGEAETANASLLSLPGGAKCSFGTQGGMIPAQSISQRRQCLNVQV